MKKTYLSWDVGIANLAYCFIEKIDEEKNKFQIKKWGIINLREQPIHLCQERLKNNNICQKKASFYLNNNSNNIYFCKTHAKKFVPEEIIQSPCNKNDKCI